MLVKTCEACDQRLPRAMAGPGRPMRFCSNACRQRAYRSRGGVASGTTRAERARAQRA